MNSGKTADLIVFFSVHIFILLFANLCNLMTVKGFFLSIKTKFIDFFCDNSIETMIWIFLV